MIALAERLNVPVASSLLGRGVFPTRHPNFIGILPPAIGPLSETLKGYDLVVVVGSSVFPYYPYVPGPLLGDETELVAITSDPGVSAMEFASASRPSGVFNPVLTLTTPGLMSIRGE